MTIENIPTELKRLNQWVCTTADSKVPMKSWEMSAASSTNPKTWSDFETASESVRQGAYNNVGFVFNDNGYVGIDIDDGYDSDGFLSDTAVDIIGRCRSYTEKSRSGRGFHIVLRGDLPFLGKNNLSGVEVYKKSRYFIMTGDTVIYDEITHDQDAIDYVLGKYFKNMREKSKEPVFGKRIYNPIWGNPFDGHRFKIRPTYPLIGEGGRNISLTSLAGNMHTIGYTKKQIFDELMRVNQIACEKPLPTYEIESICNSITRYRR